MNDDDAYIEWMKCKKYYKMVKVLSGKRNNKKKIYVIVT